MKIAYWKYLLIAAYFIVVLLFLALYFSPTLKKINSLRVQAADFARQIEDFHRTESMFVFADRREKELIKALEAKVSASLPVVRRKEDLLQTFNTVLSFLQKRTEEFQIQDILLSTLSREMAIENAPLKKTSPARISELLSYMNNRLLFLGKEKAQVATVFSQLTNANPQKPNLLNLPNLQSEELYLVFSAPLLNSLQFISSLYSERFHLEIRRVMVGAGSKPQFFLILKFYFLDERQDVKK